MEVDGRGCGWEVEQQGWYMSGTFHGLKVNRAGREREVQKVQLTSVVRDVVRILLLFSRLQTAFGTVRSIFWSIVVVYSSSK